MSCSTSKATQTRYHSFIENILTVGNFESYVVLKELPIDLFVEIAIRRGYSFVVVLQYTFPIYPQYYTASWIYQSRFVESISKIVPAISQS